MCKINFFEQVEGAICQAITIASENLIIDQRWFVHLGQYS